MRKKVALPLLVVLVYVSFIGPVGADPLKSDYGHWGQDCPYGLRVNLGGGEGWRHHMRRAIDGWNLYIAPNYWAAPRITSVTYVGGWDSVVRYRQCTIDMDERYDIPGWGWTDVRQFSDNHHFAGAVILLDSVTWNITSRSPNPGFYRDAITAHELQHAMGLGHNPLNTSVMYTPCCSSLNHNWRDVDTLRILYWHRH